jgi:alanyl-tRNA synthetase
MHLSLTMSIQTTELRQSFIDFFRSRKHKLMARSKVFNSDPSLLFVNAGMNQLKDVFLGQRPADPKYVELMNSQVCIRAGGKHNDFDDVGRDSYHLTCFEMLGNWSLDSYGKTEAIKLAYDFLIEKCHLNTDQMYVTYFKGDSMECLPEDTETLGIWKNYFSDDKIIKGSSKDNFWMMAENGPCGVCTEIHYDLIGNRDASHLVNTGDPNVIEIWNIVAIQYDKQNGIYKPLGKTYIDTGMGLERLSMVINKKKSLYQTDAFRYLFGYAQALTGSDFFTDQYDEKNKTDVAYRIFADHIRTCVIALHHGVEFDCTGRGFVLRKIFRRMMANMYLHLNNMHIQPLMNKPVIKGLISDILNYFIEIKHDADQIQKKLIDEEKIYFGKLRNIKRTYHNLLNKKKTKAEILDKLKQSHGIDSEFVEYMDQIHVDANEYS